MSFYSRKAAVVWGVIAVVVLTVLLRLVGVANNLYDIHIDEITYGHFAQTINQGHLPLLSNNEPFFLHPPGYYALLAVWRAIFWHGQDLFMQLDALRCLNVFLAGVTAWLIFALTRLITRSSRLGLAASVLFAVDPFVIRQNTRGLMETATMLWFLLGIWLLLRYMDREPLRRVWLGVGFILGLAIVTKDLAATFLALTLGLMWLRKVGPKLKTLRYIIPAAIAPYAIWISIVALSGDLGQFLSEKTVGIRRFFGFVQVTGFNAADTPSKTGTILQTFSHYGSSYAIMGLGVLGAALLLTSKNVNHRRWGCVGAASTLLLGYTYVFGAMEEQFLYYLLVPAIVTSAAALVELRVRLNLRLGKILGVLAALSAAALVLYGTVTYAIAIAKPDDGWAKTVLWLDGHAPDGSSINVFGQGQFLLGEHDFNVTVFDTLQDLEQNHVRYVIVAEKLSQAGYTPLARGQVAKVYQAGRLVFSYGSRDSGTFNVVALSDSANTAIAAAPPQTNTPSATPSTNSAANTPQLSAPVAVVPNGAALPDTGPGNAGIVAVAAGVLGYAGQLMRLKRKAAKTVKLQLGIG